MIRELVDIILAERPNSSSSPIFFTGASLGEPGSRHVYVGVFTRCEPDDVELTSANGAAPAAPGQPQTFVSATGSDFDFVGYRIYCPPA